MRVGDHISQVQTESWNQQIVAARQWISIRGHADISMLRTWLSDTFPDLEYNEATGSVLIRDEAVLELEKSTSRIVRMIILEGVFFSLIVVIGLLYMYWTLRREAQIERHFASFLAATTHELKTPITAMRLFLDALTIPNMKKEETAEINDSLRKNLNRLDLLITKLLHARGKHARMNLKAETVDIGRETENAVRDFGEMLHKGDSDRITTEIPDGIYARVDIEHWRILVHNLIENALKYSQEKIRVKMDHTAKHARLTVTDHGVGFDKSERKLVFQRFYRLGDEGTRKSRGSGIGLYLVDEIARNHGGRVTAHSDGTGKGATFKVQIPMVKLER